VPFIVRQGVPEILELWKRLLKGYKLNPLDAEDRELFKKWSKAMAHLRENPFHPGLESHEIDALTPKLGRKVFQSYLENRTPAAGRLFWVYGPGLERSRSLAANPTRRIARAVATIGCCFPTCRH
jgi:hypothetical protein